MRKVRKVAVYLAGLSMAIVLGSGLLTSAAVQAGDCNSNSIVYCGATSKTELVQKLDNGDTVHSASDLQQVYYASGRGITRDRILGDSTVEGNVTSDGKVLVNGQVVATGALSIGRDSLPGSTQVASGIFERPTSVSFRQSSLAAWVNMDGGAFRWAIIESCGNLVRASAVVQSTTTPTPTPTPIRTPTPTSTPFPTPMPTPLPTPVPPPAPAPVIPRSGPGSVFGGIVGMVALVLTGRAYVRSRRRLMDELHRF